MFCSIGISSNSSMVYDKASVVPFCCAMALCPQCFQIRSRDCIENSTKQHQSVRVGIITTCAQCFVECSVFHHRRGASFMPFTGFFNLSAMCGE